MQEVNNLQGNPIQEETVYSTKKVIVVLGGLAVVLVALGFLIGQLFFWDKPVYESALDYQFQTAYNNVKKSPNDPQLRIELGWLYLQMKDYNKALNEYKNALKLDPKNLGAKLNIAIVYGEQKDYKKAKAELEKLIKDKPAFEDARVALASVHYHLKEYDAAIKQYQFLINANPGTVDYITLLGRVLEAKGDKKGAIAQYEKALNYVPNFEPAAEGLKRLEGKGSEVNTPKPEPNK
ncbi:MAG: tetratricopeptide repeat protein [Clostridia bacterium]|nr:tetratricopeptide repeat protein [Clostridia bacterium]